MGLSGASRAALPILDLRENPFEFTLAFVRRSGRIDQYVYDGVDLGKGPIGGLFFFTSAVALARKSRLTMESARWR